MCLCSEGSLGLGLGIRDCQKVISDLSRDTPPLYRFRTSGMRSYNPEQIMLSATVGRSSRDVNVMKEKLIFSGELRPLRPLA